jgi:glycosyltransferase involved in cell wall biosynthesis
MNNNMYEDVAVLLPARNESISIVSVINDFKKYLPGATVFVCDNSSTDNTAEVAAGAGAVVVFEPKLGKANAMARLFQVANASIYIMIDADDTYDARSAPDLLRRMKKQNLDMLIISREAIPNDNAFRPLHSLGNSFFTLLFKLLFRFQINDVLSGYRFMSRRFVKSLPIMSRGFDIEIEMTAVACACGFGIGNFQAKYSSRKVGSESKLKTFSDGLRILIRSLVLTLDYRPIFVFGSISTILLLTAIYIFYPIWIEFLSTGQVPRFPSAILCLGLVIISITSLQIGLVLNGITRARVEAKKLQANLISTLYDSQHDKKNDHS